MQRFPPCTAASETADPKEEIAAALQEIREQLEENSGTSDAGTDAAFEEAAESLDAYLRQELEG